LASYGYIAVSIDLNDMNLPTNRFPAIVQRGLTILDHIDRWGTFNASDPIFAGKVDLDQIGLVGHSRGAEAVVSAQRSNVDQGRGHKIKGVVSISPTDFLGIVLPSAPYLVVYGSEDGDVSIGWPFRLYDRAEAPKAMIFVYGAIHNRFSTNADWLSLLDSNDPRSLSEADHLNLARGFCLGFLDMIMRNVGDHAQLFKRNGRPSRIAAAVEMHHQVQDPTRLTVDNFEQGALNRAAALPPQLATRAGTNTLAGSVTVAGLAVPTGLANARTQASLQHRDIGPFWHDTIGGMVAWDAVGGTYTTAVGDRNVSAFAVLSFRVAQRFDSPRNPNPAGATTPGAAQDCTATLVDSAGQSASVRAGTIVPIPFPYKRTVPALTKSALRTIRIPLSAFTVANGNLNLASIRSVRFGFGPAARGELAIDDIEFTN
jgi:dienelactone hydrolase